MLTDILDILKACRRSRTKVRVYRGLFELKSALPAELAHFAQTTPERVLGVLYGDDVKFRKATSLVTLGIARPDPDRKGEYYTITLRGDAAFEPVMSRLQKTRGPPEG